MNNFKRIIAFICIAVMMLSISAFAFEADIYPLKIKASKATVAPGETFTLTFYADGVTSAKTASYIGGTIEYCTDEFTVANVGEQPSFVGGLIERAYYKDNAVSILIDALSDVTTDANGVIASFNVTVADDLAEGNYTFEMYDMYYESDAVPAGTDYYEDILTITVTGGEEEFDLSYEGVKAEDGTVSEGFASGSKVATVFAKNETGSELAAESYGIVFGGQKYVGAAPVAAGKYWVIKLYDPTSTILVGTSYKYQTFTGDSYSVEQTYTFN